MSFIDLLVGRTKIDRGDGSDDDTVREYRGRKPRVLCTFFGKERKELDMIFDYLLINRSIDRAYLLL